MLHEHRVHGHGPAFEIQRGGQGPNGRGLVAFVRERFLPEHLPGMMLDRGDKVVVAAGVVAGGAADALAVDGPGLVVAVLLRGPSARGAVQDIGVERDQDIEERDRGGRGEPSQAVAVEGSKGAKLVLGQSAGKLRERSRAMVSGELRGHRDGQDRGQRVAPPPRAAPPSARSPKRYWPRISIDTRHNPRTGSFPGRSILRRGSEPAIYGADGCAGQTTILHSFVAFRAGRIPWPPRESTRFASRGDRRTLASARPQPHSRRSSTEARA